ncbi:MAG: FeoA family protein [Peptostreptococcus sp.]|uniref:FeoA family protein n=1 Tax=Peptostreptococcus sp. TaxID=1262 RepID=UPI002FC66124
MNLSLAPIGVPMRINKVRLKGEQKTQLANMGFVEDSELMAVSENAGNIIVNIKGSRVGIGKELATRIMITPSE